jgi:hypothetical protein
VLRIAASIGGSVIVSDVTAEIVDGLTIDASGELSVKAIADTDAKAEAISLAFTQSESESDNVSAAVAFNVALLDANAYLGNGDTVAGSVIVEAGTSAGQMNEFKALALSGAGSKQSSTGGDTSGGNDGGGGTGGDSSSLGIAGAVAFTVYGSPATDDPNTVSAVIADGADVIASTGDIAVTARQDVGMQNLAGGAALTISSSGGGGGGGGSSDTTVGAAVGIGVADFDTLARVGSNATVAATGDVSVSASSSISPLEIVAPLVDVETGIEVTTLAIGAAVGSGGDAGAGSAAINVITPTTRASIGAGADVDADGDVSVTASSDVRMVDVAGAIGITIGTGDEGGSGVGIGLGVTVHIATTEAVIEGGEIGSPTTVDAGGNVIVEAESVDEFFQLTANAGAGESTSGAGGLNVLVNITDTRALVNDDLNDATTGAAAINATGSATVAAVSRTDIESYAGSLGVSLSESAVGISVGVVVDLDDTLALVGDATDITALGNGTAVEVSDGVFDGSGDPGSQSVRGLAVTATSYDDIYMLAIAASASLGQDSSGNSGSGSGGSESGGGTAVGIAGAVTVAIVNGETKALLGDDVDVNADNAGAHADQGILVRATDETNVTNDLGGLSFVLNGDAGVTGSVVVNVVDSTTWAKAEGNNTLNSRGGGVTFDANGKNDVDALAIAVAGTVSTSSDSGSSGNSGRSFQFAGSGAVIVDVVNSETLAEIAAGGSVHTEGDLSVTADDHSVIVADSGGVAISIAASSGGDGTSAGSVGASVAVNDLVMTTRATVTDTPIEADNVAVTATNASDIDTLVIAGSASVSTSDNAFAGAGAVALNYITATTEASITNPGGRKNVTAGNDVTITATDSSTIDADAGAGALAVSTDSDAAAAVAAGAAVAENRITRTTTAKLESVRISSDGATGKIAGDVDVSAAASGDIRAFTLGISGAVSTGATVTAALAGSGSGNYITSDTTATIDPSLVYATGDVTVDATDSADIDATAGAAAFSLAVGGSGGDTSVGVDLGIALAINEVDNSAIALIDDTTVEAGGTVSVTAASTSAIDALAFGVALGISTSSGSGTSVSVNGTVAVTYNEITNTTSASITDSDTASVDTVTAGGGVTLSATESGSIVADAVSVTADISIGSGSGTEISGDIAASVAINDIENTTEAVIDSVDTTANGPVSLTATSSKSLSANVVAASVGVSGSSGGGTQIGLTGAGASATNTTHNSVLAIIDNADVTANALGSVSLVATDATDITANVVAAALGVTVSSGGNGGSLTVAVTVAENTIDNTTQALVMGGSTIDAEGDFDAHASSTGSISAVGVAASVSVGVSSGGSASLSGAGAGVGATNTITNAIEAGVIEGSSVLAGGAASISAADSASIDASVATASVSVSAGSSNVTLSLAAAVSVATNTIDNDVQAHVLDSSLHAGGALDITATSDKRAGSPRGRAARLPRPPRRRAAGGRRRGRSRPPDRARGRGGADGIPRGLLDPRPGRARAPADGRGGPGHGARRGRRRGPRGAHRARHSDLRRRRRRPRPAGVRRAGMIGA